MNRSNVQLRFLSNTIQVKLNRLQKSSPLVSISSVRYFSIVMNDPFIQIDLQFCDTFIEPFSKLDAKELV